LEPIEDTPFGLLKEEEDYYITWGDYKLTEAKETDESALELLTREKWLIVARMVFAMMHAKDLKNQNQK